MTSPADLYNPATGRLKPAGQAYLKKILKKNPKSSNDKIKEILALTGMSGRQLSVSVNKKKEQQKFSRYFRIKSAT